MSVSERKKQGEPVERNTPLRTVLRMHREFYSAEAIRDAAQAFHQVAHVEFTPGRDYHRVTLECAEQKEDDRLADEFLNYALFRTVQIRRKN